jgi:hypothetical protein
MPASDLGCLGAVLCLELAQDVGHMIFDCALGQYQLPGDLAIRVPLGE